MFKKIKWTDKVIISAVLAFALINPLVGQYIIQGIIYAYETLLTFSDEVALVSIGAILVAVLASKLERKKAYNYKLKNLKSKKAKTPAYIE